MTLSKFTLTNFRGYKNPTTIDFENLTAFIGKNDYGKSTILEALDIFFNDNKGLIKIDKTDINVESEKENNLDIIFIATFKDLPTRVVLDDSYETNLTDEYLLNKDNELEIVKTFKNGLATTASTKIHIKALHPTNPECSNLLQQKNTDLKKIVDKLNLACDKTVNASMRQAIWHYFSDNLKLEESLIDVTAKDGEIKTIWTKLQQYLPSFSLFQSDRKNSDGDSEIQDPLKEAVKSIFSDSNIQKVLTDVAQKVKDKIQEVADLTLQKINEMSPEISKSLHPNIPAVENLKWYEVFKGLSISGDEDIPINKRGSGVRRLILLNFFRAEAERKQKETNNPSIIYAIEEPETSQHKEYQGLLVNAFKELANKRNTQIIITTHSSEIVKNLESSNIKMILHDNNNKPIISNFNKHILPYASLNEANYSAFGDISEEFHNELYGFLQLRAINDNENNSKEKSFDNWLRIKGCDINKTWVRQNSDQTTKNENSTLQTFIRNYMHHPENNLNKKYTKSELETSIEQMVKIARANQ